MLVGYRTIITNLLLAIVPVLEMTDVSNILSESWGAWYALIIVVANSALRIITTTPVGQSE